LAYSLAYLIKLILIIFIGLLYCLICALLLFYLVFMSKKQKLDKKTRARLRELAKVENPYNLLGSNSTYRGFSTHGGKSKRCYYQAISNANQNQLANFVDSGRSQKIYS